MPTVRTYDAKKVIVSFFGTPLGGYADGDFLTITRRNDSFTDVAGSDGEVARSKSNDKRGDATLSLLQTSLSNDILSGVSQVDERTGKGVGPLIVKDLSGATTYFSGSAWIKKPPDGAFGKEIKNRDWPFVLASMDVFTGGVLTS